MATNLPPLLPCTPDRAPSSTSAASWWTPLFGWPSEPGYLDPSTTNGGLELPKVVVVPHPAQRARRVHFTEDKARQLRRMTTDSGSFPHEMYHSSIAARLASDFGDQS